MTENPAAVEALKLADEVDFEPMKSAWPLDRAADMLTAYAELVKATGRYAEEHYIPEVEQVVAELKALAHQPPANTPAHTPPTGVSGAVQAKREPLTDTQIEPLFYEAKAMKTVGEKDEFFWFGWGIELAERAHGIGAASEGAEGNEDDPKIAVWPF